MKLLVAAGPAQREELAASLGSMDTGVEWITEPREAEKAVGADAFIDLLFENSNERIRMIKELKPFLIVVNSVTVTLKEMQEDFVRINGWNTFLKGTVIEASCNSETLKETTGRVFSLFNKKLEWLPDISGFITPRVVSAIINEAYFSLEEKVSSKKEIDTAMKLGTNYPYGPFEWSEKIGLKNIAGLLKKLSHDQERYRASALLTKEALA